MDTTGTKRKSQHGSDGPHKAPKLGDGNKSGKMTFAQRMMAKMGYVEGQGLGRDGEGIVKPIEVKLRPQGAGVGTVKEKTDQAKAEERRRAEIRGEEYEDSSEEERKRRRQRQKHGARDNLAGSNKQRMSRAGKTKYRTVADIQAAAPGLDVPSTMLPSILDATSTERKLLTSAAGLMTPVVAERDKGEVEREKLEKRERLELEAFIDAWHGIQEQKIYYEEQEGQHSLEVEQMCDDLESLGKLLSAVEELDISDEALGSADQVWQKLVLQLNELQNLHAVHDTKHDLQEAAVSAMQKPFKAQIDAWSVVDEPTMLVADLIQLGAVLGLKDKNLIDSVAVLDDLEHASATQPASTSYETLLQTIWLPHVRRTVQQWDVTQYQAMLELAQAWKPVLTPYITATLMDQIIVPKLKAALQEWDPRKRSHHHKRASIKTAHLSSWLFPWLPHFAPYQLDPEEADSIMAEVRRKLRSVLSGWNIASGLVPGLEDFHELPGLDFEHLVVKYLLPRLASHLAREFEVNPADQDLTALERVLEWQEFLKPEILARLLAAEFFPKWLAVLHEWLVTPGASFDEILEWLAFWRQQIQGPVSQCTDVVRGWAKGTEMLNSAVDILDVGGSLTSLRAPAAGPAKPLTKSARETAAHGATTNEQIRPDTVDFREALETWCAEEDLTLIPLREAHPQTGLPLYRITASASGKGGVIVYIKGDVVWAQKKGVRGVFDPVGLDDALIRRAEGS